mmetsp:Transcript_15040/g.28226  ORF Transcript_15040/g.28226 Transcript_15040/m.28226 type:complete len:282 (+) Transcript_15040:334-1179(+)
MEVHGRQLSCGHIHHVDVQGLRLVDVSPSVSSHVQDDPLFDLPDCLVELLDVRGKIQSLHGAVLGHELDTQLLVPQASLDQILQQVTIDLHKLSRQDAADVEVLCVGLEGLVVAQDLGRACGGHGRHQQRVSKAMGSDPSLQPSPIPAPRPWLHAPHVKLKLTLARRAPCVGLVRAMLLRQLTGSLACREVDRLKDVLVQLHGFLALEGQLHHQKGISQALHTQAHRAMAHVRVPRLWDRIVIPVNDLVQVSGHHFRDLVEALEVVAVPPVASKGGQCDRG